MNRREALKAVAPLTVGAAFAPLTVQASEEVDDANYWDAQWKINELHQEIDELKAHINILKNR